MDYESVISAIGNSSSLNLVPDKHKALSYPDRQRYYVRPDLIPLNASKATCPVMLISAPGATGKSALAKAIGYEKQICVWDMGKIAIGDNCFIGTLLQSFGADKVSEVLAKIKANKMSFIFDALDEAEAISGWNRVESFIREISLYIADCSSPAAIILARSETAKYISMLLEDQWSGRYSFFEIAFFNKEKASDFILNHLKVNYPLSTSHFPIIRPAIASILKGISDKIDVDKADANSKTVRSFAGYAPVLQAIGVYIGQFKNFQELSNEVAEYLDYSNLISLIIRNILEREQGKVVDAIKIKLQEKNHGSEAVGKLYSLDEQMVRIHSYIERHRIGPDDYIPTETYAGRVYDVYLESLEEFLPQHPFILDSDGYASPTFSDYVMARLLKNCDYAYLAESKLSKQDTSISPLFWDFYLYGDEQKIIKARHIPFMYEAAIAGKSYNDDIFTMITQDGSAGAIRIESRMRIEKNEDGIDKISEARLEISEVDSLNFLRGLSNILIRTGADIHLGRPDAEFEIYNIDLQCRKLVFAGSKLNVRGYEKDRPSQILASSYQDNGQEIRVEKKGDAEFIISWPNGKVYPWSDYFAEIEKFEVVDLANSIRALQKILICFRKDGRESIARYAEFVENVAIGSSQIKQRMRDYLISNKVIWKDAGLYRLDHQRAEHFGISFNAVSDGKMNPRLEKYLRDFH